MANMRGVIEPCLFSNGMGTPGNLPNATNPFLVWVEMDL
jgi:hypothetical protein